MKWRALGIVFLCASECQAAVVTTRVSSVFGPDECVALVRSSGGSCVISTDCQGKDLSQTEFAFNCIGEGGEGGIVRHSFGFGGFDEQEEFDTEVKCDRCDKASIVHNEPSMPEPFGRSQHGPSSLHPSPITAQPNDLQQVQPTSLNAEAKPQQVDSTTDAEAKPQRVQATLDAVRYGPNRCVSTYKNEIGRCVMQTNCTKSDTSEYTFGLVCVDRKGAPVRHLFGRDSFDPEETFDTQIQCDQCLGLEDVVDAVSMNAGVDAMTNDMAKLKHWMQDISMQVQRLNTKVLRPRTSFMQGSATTMTHVHHNVKRIVRKHGTRHNLRHGRKKHHHRKAVE